MDSHKTFYPAGIEIGQYQDYPGINFAVWVVLYDAIGRNISKNEAFPNNKFMKFAKIAIFELFNYKLLEHLTC